MNLDWDCPVPIDVKFMENLSELFNLRGQDNMNSTKLKMEANCYHSIGEKCWLSWFETALCAPTLLIVWLLEMALS